VQCDAASSVRSTSRPNTASPAERQFTTFYYPDRLKEAEGCASRSRVTRALVRL